MIKIGNCIDLLSELPDCSVDSIVTDPPYELGFMNKKWDSSGIAYNVDLWKECLRVLKPGGHLLAFSGSRTYHRMTVAIEDAGFEIRDQIMWVYGSGFPKSHDVSKAIDKMKGAERIVVEKIVKKGGDIRGENGYRKGSDRPNIELEITIQSTEAAKEWDGWGTALKPAHEPICLARKPLIGTVAENVLEWGVGGINIDGCRIETIDDLNGWAYAKEGNRKESQSLNSKGMNAPGKTVGHDFIQPLGRFPANFIHDGSDEIMERFPESTSKGGQLSIGAFRNGDVYGKGKDVREPGDPGYGDSGSAARFFYCAKASKKDRDEGLDGMDMRNNMRVNAPRSNENEKHSTMRRNHHPTVKPTSLMQYLCRLVTPPNGIVLDPFMESGSTGKATMYEGFRFIGIDLDPEYCKIAKSRIEFALNKANTKEEKKPKGFKSSKQTSSDNTDNSSSPLW